MSAFIVDGGAKLSGSFRVCGNKNEALPVIAAALLYPETITLTNVPDIGDICNMDVYSTSPSQYF